MSETHQLTKTDTIAICKALNNFILNHFPLARKRHVQYADSLVESGIVDSLGMLDIVTFLESEFNFTVEDEDLTPENFQSILQIAAYVEKKQPTPSGREQSEVVG